MGVMSVMNMPDDTAPQSLLSIIQRSRHGRKVRFCPASSKRPLTHAVEGGTAATERRVQAKLGVVAAVTVWLKEIPRTVQTSRRDIRHGQSTANTSQQASTLAKGADTRAQATQPIRCARYETTAHSCVACSCAWNNGQLCQSYRRVLPRHRAITQNLQQSRLQTGHHSLGTCVQETRAVIGHLPPPR